MVPTRNAIVQRRSDNSEAWLVFSAYKLANCSTICMKYFTLVFLAASGLDFQAALRACKNICTPVSVEFGLIFFSPLLSSRQRKCPDTNLRAQKRQGVFCQSCSFSDTNKEPASSSSVPQSRSAGKLLTLREV